MTEESVDSAVCFQGHPIGDADAFCGLCGSPAASSAPPSHAGGGSEAPVTHGSNSRVSFGSKRVAWIVGGIALSLLLAVTLVVALAGSSDSSDSGASQTTVQNVDSTIQSNCPANFDGVQENNDGLPNFLTGINNPNNLLSLELPSNSGVSFQASCVMTANQVHDDSAFFISRGATSMALKTLESNASANTTGGFGCFFVTGTNWFVAVSSNDLPGGDPQQEATQLANSVNGRVRPVNPTCDASSLSAGVGSTSSGSTPASLAPPSFVGQTTLPPTTQPVEPPTTSYIPPTTIPMVSFGPNAIPGMTVEAAESTLNGLGFQTVVQHVDPSQCAGIHVDRVQAVAQPGSTYEDTGTYFYGQAPQGSTIALWVCQ